MFLALRELSRSKLRFTLLALAVAVLVWLVLLIQGLSSGLIIQFIGAIDNQDADVLVYGEQARRNLEGSVVTPEQEAEVVAAVGSGETGRLGEGTFTVTAGGELRDAVLFGYELGRPGAPTTLVEGRLPEGPGEGVASANSASDGFDLGDTFTVEPGGEPITIVGRAENINYSVSPTVFVSFDTYAEARKIRNPDAQEVWPSAITVIVPPGVSPTTLAEQINLAVAGVEALTRDEAVEGSPGVSSVRTSLGLVVGLALLIVPIVAAFFFVILTVQKAPSLTLLRAIGASKASLVTALVVQAAVVLLGGFAVALALTTLVGGLVGGDVGVALTPASVGFVLAVVLVLSTIGLLFSVARVLRIDPIEATRTPGAL